MRAGGRLPELDAQRNEPGPQQPPRARSRTIRERRRAGGAVHEELDVELAVGEIVDDGDRALARQPRELGGGDRIIVDHHTIDACQRRRDGIRRDRRGLEAGGTDEIDRATLAGHREQRLAAEFAHRLGKGEGATNVAEADRLAADGAEQDAGGGHRWKWSTTFVTARTTSSTSASVIAGKRGKLSSSSYPVSATGHPPRR